MTLAGRVSVISTLPERSATWSLWVRNWSNEVSRRSAFLAVVWPTSRTTAIFLPSPSKTAYSFCSSMSFIFWFTTSTRSVKRVPPPAVGPGCTPERTT